MTDKAAPELHITRIFEAPRELVFACMTEPQHLTHFWGPAGTHAPLEHIRVEAHAGGVFETTMVSDEGNHRYDTRAVYLEVSPPERLVWRESHSGMTVTVTFVELGDDRTKVMIHQANVPPAALTPQARAGFLTSLDRFADYLEGLSRSGR